MVERLLPILSDPGHPAAQRFQQTSGMVMAKGVEDTAFYRYTRLTSLTEVGGDPAEFAIDVAEFHARALGRQERMPRSMTTLSTHDTKRGEDVRARLDVIAELPAEWAAILDELRSLAPLGDGPLEHLLWQAIVGAWPASPERLHAYAEKAAREAGELDVVERRPTRSSRRACTRSSTRCSRTSASRGSSAGRSPCSRRPDGRTRSRPS